MELRITAQDGRCTVHEVDSGQTLMRVLRDMPEGVSGICGGVMACGTCHVYVDDAHLTLLSRPSTAERQMLDSLDSVRSNSRLSCQIYLTSVLKKLALSIAPEI